jgi:ketosteroid isomerase-like protein
MSEENVAIVREMVEIWNRGDLEGWGDFLADDVVWHPLAENTQTAPVSGRNETLEFLRDWLAPWQVYEIEVRRYVDAGEKVVMLTTQTGRHESGAEVPIEMHGVVLLRDGRVAEMKWFQDESAALEEAAGSE